MLTCGTYRYSHNEQRETAWHDRCQCTRCTPSYGTLSCRRVRASWSVYRSRVLDKFWRTYSAVCAMSVDAGTVLIDVMMKGWWICMLCRGRLEHTN